MNRSQTETISLSALKRGYPGITPAVGESFAEAAAICLEDQNHNTDVEAKINGHVNKTFALSWESPDDQQRRAWADMQDATEQGAYGIAALLIDCFTDLHVVERSRKGTGFDYWLGKKELVENEDRNFFQNRERLEVSGILSGTGAQIKTRVKEKKLQTGQSDGTGLPAWIAVVEFGHPQSTLEKK